MTMVTKQRIMTPVTATTPTETGITKSTSGKRSVEHYSKSICLMHTKTCTLEVKLVYDPKCCGEGKVCQRNNSPLETLDSRLTV